MNKKQTKELKEQIIEDAYRVIEEYKKENKNILISDDEILSRDYYRSHGKFKEKDISVIFGSFSNLKKEACLEDEPDCFSRKSFDSKIKDDSKLAGRRKYFVTAAIAGGKLNRNFFECVLTYCKYNKAELVILPMRGVYKKDEKFNDDILKYSDYFLTEMIFNSNLRAVDYMLNPRMMNPLTGLARMGAKSTCMIVASPKQQMITIPTSNRKLPHILQSTGSITESHYGSTRTGELAKQDHVTGGLIVEIEDVEIFHIRQIQCNGADGGFYDLNKYYSKNKVQPGRADTFIPGDIHPGSEDPTAVAAWKECIKLTNPDYIVFHDICDSRSVNHHEEHNIRAQVNRPDDLSTLEKELNLVGRTLANWITWFPNKKFILTYGNHDNAVVRYLQEGRYVWDRFNHRISLQLAMWMLDDLNPIQQYVESKFKIKNITWLTVNDDYKRRGIQVGLHGHLGSNGSRGNLKNMEESLGKCVVGHSHTPKILRDAWCVGTTTKLRLHYTDGPSSWLHAGCLIYPNGQRQMVISIEGRWKL